MAMARPDLEPLVPPRDDEVGRPPPPPHPGGAALSLLVIIIVFVVPTLVVLLAPYPRLQQPGLAAGAKCETSCDDIGDSGWWRKGPNEVLATLLGEKLFYEVEPEPLRTSVAPVDYRTSYECSGFSRIRDQPSCVCASATMFENATAATLEKHGCRVAETGLELCFVHPVEKWTKRTVLLAALCLSCVLMFTQMCISGGASPVNGDGELKQGSELSAARAMLKEQGLWNHCGAIVKIRRWSSCMQVLGGLLINLMVFRPQWVCSYYAVLFVPVGLCRYGWHQVVSDPLCVIFPRWSLLRSYDESHLAKTSKFLTWLRIPAALPGLIFICANILHLDGLDIPSVLQESEVHKFELRTGFPILNTLALGALDGQRLGHVFKTWVTTTTVKYCHLYILHPAIPICAILFVVCMMACLPHRNRASTYAEFSAKARTIQEEAQQRLQGEDKAVPQGAEPITLRELTWRLLHVLFDIVTDAIAWARFLSKYDFLFAFVLATVSWWSTLVQVRKCLWAKLPEALEQSRRSGVLTADWIELMDTWRGRETLFASLLQLYACLFNGFEDEWTSLLTLFSTWLSMKNLADYLVESRDLLLLYDDDCQVP